jgi:alpha-N-arabinofuranosidase
VSVSGGKAGKIGLANSGFWGMDVKAATRYAGSFYVRGAYKGAFTASLQSALGEKEVFGSVEVQSKSVADGWTQHEYVLVPGKSAPNSNNTLAITFDAAGVEGALDFNLVSLFPPTWKGRKNGLRVDLAEAFAALNPVCFSLMVVWGGWC